MRVRFAARGRVKAFTLTKPLRCFGSRMCHKSHAIQFIICAPVLRTQKDLSCPAISQAKEVSYSLYIRFDCTQKLPFYLNSKGWLVARIVPIIYIFVTISHARVHLLSKIYIPILPQSEVIVKCKFFREFGRIFRCDYLLCFRLSNFVGIRRKFLAGKFQYIACIYFHVMLLLSYRFCMNQSTRAGSEMEKKYG